MGFQIEKVPILLALTSTSLASISIKFRRSKCHNKERLTVSHWSSAVINSALLLPTFIAGRNLKSARALVDVQMPVKATALQQLWETAQNCWGKSSGSKYHRSLKKKKLYFTLCATEEASNETNFIAITVLSCWIGVFIYYLMQNKCNRYFTICNFITYINIPAELMNSTLANSYQFRVYEINLISLAY